MQMHMDIAGKNFEERSFLFIPAGDCEVGIDEKDIINCKFNETLKRSYLEASTPKHKKALRPCAISRFLISFMEFERFVRDTGYKTDAEKEGWAWLLRGGRWQKVEGLFWKMPFGNEADAIYREKGDLLPALQLSWNDASAYCEWLSQKCNKEVHLPGEVQWEQYAKLLRVPSLADVDKASSIIAAKSFVDDARYLYEIETRFDEPGNLPTGVLWEWCHDWYDAYPGGPRNREFGKVYKVLRGGSLQSHHLQNTREYRFRRCPTARSAYYGFRIAVEM